MPNKNFLGHTMFGKRLETELDKIRNGFEITIPNPGYFPSVYLDTDKATLSPNEMAGQYCPICFKKIYLCDGH
jgi:hypothetical protein